jgi:hypothetical protein
MKTNSKICNGLFILIMMALVVISCQDIPEENVSNQVDASVLFESESNELKGSIPDATVPLSDYSSFKNKKGVSYVTNSESESSLTMPIVATLNPTESITQTLTGSISGSPNLGDLMFILDLTGSMGDELNNAKNNSVNIMNAVRGLIPDTNFGLMSHMDNIGFYNFCGYSASYGEVASGDYPYSLDVPLTDNILSVSAGLNALSLGFGGDGPENFSRPLWELSNDNNVVWRTGSKRIAIFWLDNIPHDCNVYSLIGFNGISAGVDPGRDGIAGTADDVAFLDALNQMQANNVNLITLYSGTNNFHFDLWKAASQLTGGDAYQINTNATIPGGLDIATFIASLLSENLNTINSLSVTSCDPAYSSWVTGVSPISYTNLSLETPIEKMFDVTITVPDGTEPGLYTFDLCLIGDGAEYARTSVTITVPNTSTLAVPFDIRPGSCPNPIKTNMTGLLPVAILGSSTFNVQQIDVSTIRINGLSPSNYSISDVSTPYLPISDKPLLSGACNTLGADGYMDLTLRFNAPQFIGTLGSVSKRQVIKIFITGKLLDGTDFIGEDNILIQ